MSGTEQSSDLKYLLGGIALLVSGLILLGATLGLYSLDSHFSLAMLTLATGIGFAVASRMNAAMRWAAIPSGLFLIYGTIQLLQSLHPGAGFTMGPFIGAMVMVGLAISILLVFKPSPSRWWPIIPSGILFFGGLELVLQHVWSRADSDGPMVMLYGIAITFLAIHLINRRSIWSLIVAGAMGLLAVTFTVEELFPRSDLGGAVFTFLLGLIFLFVHFRRRRVWWPVIPGGILCVLGVFTQLESMFNLPEPFEVCLIFFGFAAVFGYLYLISNETNKLAWARYPAVALAGVGFFALVVDGGGRWFVSYVLPVALLVAGAIYIIRALRARGRE